MLLIQLIILLTVAFGVVIFFLKKMLRDDTESAINRLNRVYQDLLKRQEELTQKIQTAEKEYAQKKEEAEQIKAKLTAEAVEEARQKKDAVLKTAKEEADDVVARAHASTDKFIKEIEKKLAEKTIDFAGELIGQVFTEKMNTAIHQELVREFIANGDKLDLSGVSSNIEKLTVKSALPLTAGDKEKLFGLLESKLSRSVKIEEVNDKSVIAGIQLQFGTLMLDGTLKNLLKEAAWHSKKKVETHGVG